MHYWLMKSEADDFSIDDLINAPRQSTSWDGVRNYQARNMMRDQMKVGDQSFFYHSNCEQPGIVGIVRVIREAYPDLTAFDSKHQHYDPKSDPADPRWLMVDVELVRKLKRNITLQQLKQLPGLEGFALLRRANRLSVMPVTPLQWRLILALE